MDKFIYTLVALVSAFFLWLALSYVDIVTDNITDNPQHSNLNAFVLLLDYVEEGE